jgi:hypothetical protein
VSVFAPLFEEFREREWKLLYRGSRDGFRAAAFHGKCDGHANTLTLIAETNGALFGGFTPVPWDSIKRGADPSGRSFVFTLSNPHGLPPQRFPLKSASARCAIACRGFFRDGWSGMFAFGAGHDVAVCEDCDTKAESKTTVGNTYANATGVGGMLLLAGSYNFRVREIEVFEISD